MVDDDIYRGKDDQFWKEVGMCILLGCAFFAGWFLFGVATWAMGVGCWNW